jgi:hypothetical protein
MTRTRAWMCGNKIIIYPSDFGARQSPFTMLRKRRSTTTTVTALFTAAVCGAAFGAAVYWAYSNAYGGTKKDDEDEDAQKRRNETTTTETTDRASESATTTTTTTTTTVEDAIARPSDGTGVEPATGRATRRVEHEAAPAAVATLDVKDTRYVVETYESLELAFAQAGLDPSALTPREFFHFATYPEVGCWPREHAKAGLPKDAARLVVLTMEEAPAIAAAVQSAVRELVRLVGATTDTFVPGRGSLHVTLFHVSRTFDYVAAPVECAADGADGRGTATLPPTSSAVEDAIAYEESAIADALHGCGACELEIDRVCMAPSGCLLLCFKDVRGDVQSIRERLRDKAIGSSKKQNETVHCTLARMFPKPGSSPLDPETIRAITTMCARVTSALRGARFTAQHAVYCVEERYGCVDGKRCRIKL